MNINVSGVPSSYYAPVEKNGENYIHDNYHLDQIQQMINTTINDCVPRMIQEYVPRTCAEIMRQIIPPMIDALHTDITSIVQIGFDNAHDIWTDSKTQAYISDRVMNTIRQKLEDIVITIEM